MRFFLCAAILVALPAVAQAEVSVDEPWARASILASRPAAAYLTVTSDEKETLLGASSPAADTIMIHAVETDATGARRMQHRETIELQAGEPLAFEPGGMHLMLVGLKSKLVEGTSFPLTLRFETTGEITIEVPVLGAAASGPAGEAE